MERFSTEKKGSKMLITKQLIGFCWQLVSETFLLSNQKDELGNTFICEI